MHNSNNSALSKDIFFQAKNHTNINSISNNSSALKEISIAKAKKPLTKSLLTSREVMQMLSNLEAAREAIKIFNERNNIKLPDNITEPPNFNRNKTKSANLPESAEETFSGIRARARKAFVKKADELNINGNISEHDPLALEQAIEEATHNSYLQDKNLCFCFSITKRVEV
jgi:hypothetical protein